jgi:hypothetical protein
MRAHPKHLNENSKHRWIKAIYMLADFKRTGILSLRREKRGFVFSEVAKSAFQQFTAHQSAIGLSEAHIRDTCLYLERFSKYLEKQYLENIAGLETGMCKGSLIAWPYTNYPLFTIGLACCGVPCATCMPKG